MYRRFGFVCAREFISEPKPCSSPQLEHSVACNKFPPFARPKSPFFLVPATMYIRREEQGGSQMSCARLCSLMPGRERLGSEAMYCESKERKISRFSSVSVTIAACKPWCLNIQ